MRRQLKSQGRYLIALLAFISLNACTNPNVTKEEEALMSESVFSASTSGFAQDEVIPPIVVDEVIPPVVVDPTTPTTPTQPEVPTVPEVPTTPPVVVDPTPPTTPAEPEVPTEPEEPPVVDVCMQSSVKTAVLANVVTAAGGKAGYNKIGKVSCQSSMGYFDATTTNNKGQIKNHSADSLRKYSNLLVFGVNCTKASSSADPNMLIKGFGAASIRNFNKKKDLVKTALCRAGSQAPCVPSNPGFIAEVYWNGTNVASIAMNEVNISNEELQCGGVKLESPLIIEERQGAGVATMNPFLTNTMFDIKGDGVKHRISCVKEGAYLALPNAQGQIKNINQLFGNNTVGPDNEKASNGFTALGKYDSNDDGVIDAADGVYSKLVLWKDANCDGVAQASEVSSLSRLKVKTIKWAAAKDMYQVDQWGNATMQRSIVNQTGGGLLRIFDVWFKLY